MLVTETSNTWWRNIPTDFVTLGIVYGGAGVDGSLVAFWRQVTIYVVLILLHQHLMNHKTLEIY